MTALQARCPLCGSMDLAALLDRCRVPVFQNLAHRDARSAREAETGRLAVRICQRCGFGMNAAFLPELVQYQPAYVNDQSRSPRFARHLAERVDAVTAQLPRSDAIVAEVGCGQGQFLALITASGRVDRAYGFDPAAREAAPAPRVTIRQEIFDPTSAASLGPFDAVIARHVIEHVPRPVDFARALGRAAALPWTRIFVETPCLEWILAHQAVQDFFYEHCNYFTVSTLRFTLELAGLEVIRVDHVFDAQYLWAEARVADTTLEARPRNAANTLAAARRFAARHDEATAALRRAISGSQPTALWGAGAKGATLAALLDPERSMIDCLIDINPEKQGSFIPGSAHQVVSPEQAAARGVRRVVVMNASYRDEIEAQIASRALPFVVMTVDGGI